MKPESRQEIASRLVVEAEGLVMRQQALVAQLQKDGEDATLSLELLMQFEKARANFRRTLDLLKSTRTL